MKRLGFLLMVVVGLHSGILSGQKASAAFTGVDSVHAEVPRAITGSAPAIEMDLTPWAAAVPVVSSSARA